MTDCETNNLPAPNFTAALKKSLCNVPNYPESGYQKIWGSFSWISAACLPGKATAGRPPIKLIWQLRMGFTEKTCGKVMASGDDEDEKEEESINGLGAKGAIKDTECSFRR